MRRKITSNVVVLKTGHQLVYRIPRGSNQQQAKVNSNCRVKYVSGGNATIIQKHRAYAQCAGPYNYLLADMERAASKSAPVAKNDQARIDEIAKLADDQRRDSANKGARKRPEVIHKPRTDKKK